jgi:hypothetical protein
MARLLDYREDCEWHLHQEAVEILHFNGAELAQECGIANTKQKQKVKLHFRVNLACRFRTLAPQNIARTHIIYASLTIFQQFSLRINQASPLLWWTMSL